MEIMENIKKLMQEFIVPELSAINNQLIEIKATVAITNKRMDDMNAYIVDQSRRIDNLRMELRDEMVGLREELKEEIAELKGELKEEIAKTNKRIDETRIELKDEIFKNTLRIDGNNMRIDSLYIAIVRREEHEKLEIRTGRLEQDMVQTKSVIQEKMAA
ncbi:MAG: hypothetical protein ABH886_00970 [Candidatus Desantisbacteria bacterium]